MPKTTEWDTYDLASEERDREINFILNAASAKAAVIEKRRAHRRGKLRDLRSCESELLPPAGSDALHASVRERQEEREKKRRWRAASTTSAPIGASLDRRREETPSRGGDAVASHGDLLAVVATSPCRVRAGTLARISSGSFAPPCGGGSSVLVRPLGPRRARAVATTVERQLARWSGPILVGGAGSDGPDGCRVRNRARSTKGSWARRGYRRPRRRAVVHRCGQRRHPTPMRVEWTRPRASAICSGPRRAVRSVRSSAEELRVLVGPATVTLADKQDTTRRLLASGASIDAVNTRPKALSRSRAAAC